MLDEPHRSTELLLLVVVVVGMNALQEAAPVVDDTVTMVELVTSDCLACEDDVDVELSGGGNKPGDREVVVLEKVGVVEAGAKVEVEDDASRKLPNSDDAVDVVEVVDVAEVVEVVDEGEVDNVIEIVEVDEIDEADEADEVVDAVEIVEVTEAVDVVKSSKDESAEDREVELGMKLPEGYRLLGDEDRLEVGDELMGVSS